MPFSDVDPSIETFLEPTRIFLFGKPFPTLGYNPAPMSEGVGNAGAVERALRELGDEGIFARIYGFSFEGHYYKLPRPVLFLVKGEGGPRAAEEAEGGSEPRFSTRSTGIESKDWQFGSDIRVWAVDKHDIAVRLDLEIGSYEQVLLQPLAATQEEGASRSAGWNGEASRNAASFRGKVWGAHQDR